MAVRVTNAGPGADDAARAADRVVPQHLVVGRRRRASPSCGPDGDGARSSTEHPFLGALELVARRATPDVLFCENETNTQRLFGVAPAPPYPKDGINDHVVDGRGDRRPADDGHEGRVLVPARRSSRARRRRSACGSGRPADAATRGPTSTTSSPSGVAEADEFYAELTPADASDGRGARAPPGLRRDALEQAALRLRRRALARRRPDPAAAARVAARGRNAGWRTFDAFDIMSMPDPWEYPWFAAWDLAFHCVALAHVDPAFAKYQLIAAVPRVVPAPERRARRPTSGRSTTSTRRCRPGRRSRCSTSTAAATPTS